MVEGNSLSKKITHLFSDGFFGVIFDCDGVITDSKKGNIGYYNMILKELGYQAMSEEQAAYVQMVSVKEAIDYIIPESEHVKLDGIVKKKPYESEVLPNLEVEPGLVDFLLWLRKKGFNIAIHTNRTLQGVRAVIEHFKLTDIFDPVMTVDAVPAKPHPGGIEHIVKIWNVDVSKVLFIGDSYTDEGATKAVSLPFGAYKNRLLSADLYIDSFSELHQALCSIYGY